MVKAPFLYPLKVLFRVRKWDSIFGMYNLAGREEDMQEGKSSFPEVKHFILGLRQRRGGQSKGNEMSCIPP